MQRELCIRIWKENQEDNKFSIVHIKREEHIYIYGDQCCYEFNERVEYTLLSQAFF